MNEELQTLIQLQRLDTSIAELEAEISSLPRKIAEVESTLADHIRAVETSKARLAENQSSRRKRERDVSAHHEKISRYKDQVFEVKTNEQYRALLHEIEFHETNIRELEDAMLTEMIDSESLEKELQESERNLAAEQARAEREIAAARQRQQQDELELGPARTERATVIGRIPPDLYENLRARRQIPQWGRCSGSPRRNLRGVSRAPAPTGLRRDPPESTDRPMRKLRPDSLFRGWNARRVALSKPMQAVTLITDGSCIGNPGPGGWACLLRQGSRTRELSGSAPDTTNNRMELTAVIQGLSAIEEACPVRIVTDSEYVHKGITEWMEKWRRKGWRTAANKPVKNQDLWKSAGRSLGSAPRFLAMGQGPCHPCRQHPCRQTGQPRRPARGEECAVSSRACHLLQGSISASRICNHRALCRICIRGGRAGAGAAE